MILPLFKIKIRVSFWFFAALALFLLLDRQIMLWYVALPVLIHEAGHLAAMLLLGSGVAEIYLTPVSIRLSPRSAAPLSYSREMIIAAAGAAANLLAALFLWRFAFQSMRTMLLVSSNLVVACFNLLPIGNLDGGQIIRALCARLTGPAFARTVSLAVSAAVLVPLTALAVLLALREEGNLTLTIVCVYLIATVLTRE